MGTFVEVFLPGESSLIVEVADDLDSGVVLAGRMRDVAGMTSETFESALDRLKLAAEAVVGKMRNLTQSPDEVTVEFSIKLATAVGVVIANSSAEANLKVTLRWSPGAGSEASSNTVET